MLGLAKWARPDGSTRQPAQKKSSRDRNYNPLAHSNPARSAWQPVGPAREFKRANPQPVYNLKNWTTSVGCICFICHQQQHHSLEPSRTLTPTFSNSYQHSRLPPPPLRKSEPANDHPLRAATTTVSNNCHREQQQPSRHHATRWRARSEKEARIDNNHHLDARENGIVIGDAQRQQPPHFPSITLPFFLL